MLGSWRQERAGRAQSVVSADFQRELTREVMRTELIRIKALIATMALLGILLGAVYLLAPEAIDRIWHGQSSDPA